MKLILRKNVDKIGKAGQTISVKDGFARNFLLPQGLALMATDENIKRVEKEKQKVEQIKITEQQKAQGLAEKLSNFSCTITAEAHDDILYGSVSSADIAQVLEEDKIKVDEKDILLNASIKHLGIYEVEIRLHPQVTTKIKVWIVKK